MFELPVHTGMKLTFTSNCDRIFMQSFSACMHSVSKVCLFAHTVRKIPDHSFKEQSKYLDPLRIGRTQAVTQKVQVPGL